jgi:hypothetical protein
VILCCEVFSCCRGSPPRPFSGATATGRVAARGDQEPREDTYILNLGQPTTTVEYSLMKFVSALYGGKKHAAKKRHRCATCTIAIRAAGTGWIAPMLRLPLITKGMTISYFRGDAEFYGSNLCCSTGLAILNGFFINSFGGGTSEVEQRELQMVIS